MMKRIFIAVLSLTLAVALTACGMSTPQNNDSSGINCYAATGINPH